MKKFCVFILFLIVVLAGAGFWGFQQLQQFMQQPVNVQNDQLLTIERGTTGNKLVSLLEKERILDNAALLPWLLKLHPELNKVQAGTYSLNGVKTVEDLLKLLNSGKEAQFSLTFVEGETFKTIRKRLENAPHLKQTLQGKSNDEVFGMLAMDTNLNKNLTESHIIDGWIYPDTYNYTPNSTDLDLLQRSVERMKKALDKAWNFGLDCGKRIGRGGRASTNCIRVYQSLKRQNEIANRPYGDLRYGG